MTDKTHLRHEQAQTVANPGFRGMVRASVMLNAYIVQQDTSNPNYDQRAALSRTLFYAMTPPETKESITELFAWWVVNDATVIDEYKTGGADVAQISDQAIDAAVLAFWDDASAVEVGTEG